MPIMAKEGRFDIRCQREVEAQLDPSKQEEKDHHSKVSSSSKVPSVTSCVSTLDSHK